MSDKTILIFGAGINQVELIREARNLGIKSVVIDPQPHPPGKPEADFFYQVGGNDYETTRMVAEKYNVNGIVTGQMEKPLRLMAKLAKDLGLIFHSPEVIERCLDKWQMKEAFQGDSVPYAKGILVHSDEKLTPSLVDTLSFPVIIKPRDAFSSRGVYRANTFEDLISYRDESSNFASQGDVIIEEFLKGKEYSVEAISFKGETTIIQFTEKYITPYPNTVEMGHLQPADLSLNEKNSISAVVKKAIISLGIDNSASHTEIMITKQGPKVIEVGARLGGDFIASYLTKSSTGLSLDKIAVQVALGITPELRQTCYSYSMIKYIELPVGVKVKEVGQIGDIRDLPYVVFVHVFVKPGEVIQPITHSGLRPGCVLVSTNDKEELLMLADKTAKVLLSKIIY